SAARRWLGQRVTSRPNSSTSPEVAGRMPVTRLNSVVLPAPFGPITALRSPDITARSTPRTARKPPKLLLKALSSRTGCIGLRRQRTEDRGQIGKSSVWLFSVLRRPKSVLRSLAIFARREVAAVDRLLEELVLAVGPELADRRIGLDHRVPQLVLVVAEH